MKERLTAEHFQVELIIYAGYEPEFHRITTDDGYILGVVRIPKGKANLANDGPKPAVLLQHGLLGSCTNFLTNSPDQSLGETFEPANKL